MLLQVYEVMPKPKWSKSGHGEVIETWTRRNFLHTHTTPYIPRRQHFSLALDLVHFNATESTLAGATNDDEIHVDSCMLIVAHRWRIYYRTPSRATTRVNDSLVFQVLIGPILCLSLVFLMVYEDYVLEAPGIQPAKNVRYNQPGLIISSTVFHAG